MANPLKVFTALSASSGVAVSGSDGLVVNQGGVTINNNGGLTVNSNGITVSSGGASITGDLIAGATNGSGLLISKVGTQLSGSTTTSGSLTVGGGGDFQASGGTFSSTLSAQAILVTNGVLNVTGGDISGSANLKVGSNITGSALKTLNDITVGGNIVADADENKSIFAGVTSNTITIGGAGSTVTVAGNLTVQGTTTTVDSTTVTIEDKNVQLAKSTGSVDIALLDGGGIDLGSGSVVQWRYNNGSTAWKSNVDVDVASTKVYKINGTEVLSSNTLGSGIVNSSLTSVGTLSSLTVTGLTQLSGNVALGDASADVITANGQLTASQGMDIGDNKSYKLGGADIIKKASVGFALVSGSSGAAISVGNFPIGPGQTADGVVVSGTVAAVGANYVNIGPGVLANSNPELQVSSDLVTFNAATARFAVSASVDGQLVVNKGARTFTNVTVSGSYVDIISAIDELDAAVVAAGGASVSPTEYYNVRTVVSGAKQSGTSDIVFTLSGSTNGGEGGRTPSGKQLTGLSGSTSTIIGLLGGMSFDVAVKAANTNSWTNDLVSVTVSASAPDGASLCFPQITVDAPALADNSVIRLIVVNENSGIIT